ncbi:ornithine carbamoyltransferase [Legionella sp. W05-934-2]|jgi:ornithine carbamoyltransferase|uniref:ornithine carbamoyltransferase n=1 Tax=Legionella sp. W05-934-2 TaxID=1198649 RepID=UPI003462BD80
MTKLSTKHVLTGHELSKHDIEMLLTLACQMKSNPLLHANAFPNQCVALIFEKPSLRTRFSFTAAISQLGAQAIESVTASRKSELPQDFIRVIQGYCQAMMIRTFDDEDLAVMKAYAKIPIINGLTDKFHPCQSLADLMTLYEVFGQLDGLKIAYLGDGNNVLHSLMLLANKMGVTVHYCCPPGFEPDQSVIEMLEDPAMVKAFSHPQEAVMNCHAVYTDVWTSMGFAQKNEQDFQGYQVNEALMANAQENAVFMHCMPMERGKEVSETLPDAPNSVIFQQSENRMHVQKALLYLLMNYGE